MKYFILVVVFVVVVISGSCLTIGIMKDKAHQEVLEDLVRISGQADPKFALIDTVYSLKDGIRFIFRVENSEYIHTVQWRLFGREIEYKK